MRSLFAKILLWFFASTIITIAAVVITSALTYNSSSQPPFGMMIRLQMREARHAYETGGREALAAALERFRLAVPGDGVLTDSTGKDLVSGENRSELIAQASRRTRFPIYLPFPRRGGYMFGRQSADGKYWFFFNTAQQSGLLWFFQPQHLVILGVIVALCYGFAFYLTAPVRVLQRAVERFGKGDLSARAPGKRGDELGKLARTFNQMADRIQTLVTAERRLLMDISHELRSPLARLTVAIELARNGREHQASLDRIEKEGQRLNELVGELLEVTRAEGDPAQRIHEEIHIDELLEDVVEDCQIEAGARGSKIAMEAAVSCTVVGDPELLRRAVENVVRNAIRYSPQGTPVEVSLAHVNGRARITVRDRGPGVPDSSLPLLFEPFYRVESDRSRASGGGVGLGLSIAKRAVALHNGAIRASNAEPGLCVTVELPVYAKPKPVNRVVAQA